MSTATVSGDSRNVIDILIKLAHLVEVTDQVPGKITARVPFANLSKLMEIFRGSDVEERLRLIPGLKRYEISAWSRSATIRYDPSVLSTEFWKRFAAIRKDPLAEAALRERLCVLLGNGAAPEAEQTPETPAKE